MKELRPCPLTVTINNDQPKPPTFKDLGYVQVIRCKDCKHRPKEVPYKTTWGATETYLDFPDDSKCPCLCSGDTYYSWNPDDEWFCANGERR